MQQQILKLSASKLETWRLYQVEEYNGAITRQQVIDKITGVETWTPEATFGAAFHLVLQHGVAPYVSNERSADGVPLFRIQDDQLPEPVMLTYEEVRQADEFHAAHPGLIWEIPGTFYLPVDNYRAMINFRVDAMEGDLIHENKTSKRALSFDFYEASLQWRVELLGTKAQAVRYNVWSYSPPTKERKIHDVHDWDSLTLYPYQGMAEDLVQACRGVLDFCTRTGILEALIVQPKAKRYV